MTTVRKRDPPKTWSLLGEVRKKPSEYDVVTARLHFHYRRQPAPFELDPDTPINAWYRTYREGSRLQTDDWEGFRDPHQLIYRAYVERQAAREAYLENLVDEFERRDHDAGFQREWVRMLDRLYLPARFPMHALQMCGLYIGQMAPSSCITNAAYFQAADELRRIQWTAYRAKSLSLVHGADLASSAYTRRRWEEDGAWQPLREAVEKLLVAYDWGEAFAALNLAVKPVFDAVFNLQLAELARVHEDRLLALMLDDFALDGERSGDWSAALVQYSVTRRAANRELLKEWVDKWMALAYRGMEGVAELFGQAPGPLQPKAVSAAVRSTHHAFLARCGLDGFSGRSHGEVADVGVTPMTKGTGKNGVDVPGDMALWGTHFCLFYETKEDLLDGSVSFCKSGLANQEFCLWIVAEPLRIEDARNALTQAVPDLDRHLADSRIEIGSARDWFLQGGTFDSKKVTEAWFEKLGRIAARGYPGIRVTGDTTWLTKKDWNHFCEMEEKINEVIGNQHLSVLCAFPLEKCGPFEILDTVRNHQFALARRYGTWEVIESAGLKQAKAELKRLNEELERRVVDRTSQLERASEALREAQAELAHVNRVTTMGQLAASISHEVMQPITAGVTNARAASKWLRKRPAKLDEAQRALESVVDAGNRAAEIMIRIRSLFKKAPPRKEALDVNEAILGIVTLTHGEVMKNRVAVETRLAEGLPLIQADRVQLQQVILNLIVNAVEAMSGVREGARELLIRTGKDESGGVLVAVQDSGPGLSSEAGDRIFDAFYTTKAGGMGMGLSICRSIVEQHGGRIWAARKAGPGATVEFSLPVESTAPSHDAATH